MQDSALTGRYFENGIRCNLPQFLHQLLQVFLVGSMIGLTRTVLPGLSSTEFGLAEQQFILLTAFVVVFGFIKAVMNLLAGRMSERFGRKNILILGWIAALPIPVLFYFADNWYWILAATLFLGLNQGLSWSMALNSKLDLAKPTQRGLVNGLNEFSGYAAVGLAGLLAAAAVEWLGAHLALGILSALTLFAGLYLAVFHIVETRPWAEGNGVSQSTSRRQSRPLNTLFAYATLRYSPLVALNQAGMVEKFVDALVWVLLPVYLLSRELSLIQASAIISVYGVVWGASQLVTGPLSDRIGRKPLIVAGMWLCALGVWAIIHSHDSGWWTLEAALIGLGMAMLYPTLGAAVADHADAQERATILGVYRFWRDFGYAIGALIMGLAAQFTGRLESAFELVAVAMVISGLWVWLKVPRKQIH
ncbi:MFS transporter [Thiomicrorhabdus xiamenensis]|uniref:MFS transporter n=1 Tax=Thiomicrorhabdus xiamenensis TaxID=2739063 RepID=A0A7D4SZG9_9GAMM|nr:MFS transporter [Thiomicrorhabdus xiamenensis]QKI88165.1 MFS transporter [Thiomicrorhabdus xiamenensis]